MENFPIYERNIFFFYDPKQKCVSSSENGIALLHLFWIYHLFKTYLILWPSYMYVHTVAAASTSSLKGIAIRTWIYTSWMCCCSSMLRGVRWGGSGIYFLMSPRRLCEELCRACHTGRRPRGRPRTHWRVYMSLSKDTSNLRLLGLKSLFCFSTLYFLIQRSWVSKSLVWIRIFF